MEEISELKNRYDIYLAEKKKTLIKDGKVYYKLVNKDVLTLGNQRFLALTLSNKAFEKETNSIMTEGGEIIKLDSSPMELVFRGEEPEWYKETRTVTISNIRDVTIVGEYVTPVCVNVA